MGYYDPPDPPPDYCRWHGWEFDPDSEVEACPDCLAEFEAWEDGAYDRMKEDALIKPREEPDGF